MTNLLDLDAAGLATLFADHGDKPFRAKQVAHWIHQRFVDDVGAMTDLAKPLREWLAAAGTIRADFAQSIDANAVHGSDAPETAAVEIAYFFPALAVFSR